MKSRAALPTGLGLSQPAFGAASFGKDRFKGMINADDDGAKLLLVRPGELIERCSM
jgi:hypothetical protein